MPPAALALCRVAAAAAMAFFVEEVAFFVVPAAGLLGFFRRPLTFLDKTVALDLLEQIDPFVQYKGWPSYGPPP